jgi:hypothetical protein
MKNQIFVVGLGVVLLVVGFSGCIAPENQQSQGFLLNWTREPGVRIEHGVSSATLMMNTTYIMYYTAQGICMATSPDGLAFTLNGTVVDVDEPGSGQEMISNSAIIKLQNGSYRMIYEGSRWTEYFDQKAQQMRRSQIDRKLYSAFSSDGFSWKKEEGVRFQDHGDGDPTEYFTSVPDIIRLDNGDLRMYYTRGTTSATALSPDEGITWTKEQNLNLGRIVVDCDIIRLPDKTYKLFFTSFDSEFGVGEQYVMSASSSDGLNFTLDPGKRLEPSSESTPLYDPDIILLPDGSYRMYCSEAQLDGSTRIFSATSSL